MSESKFKEWLQILDNKFDSFYASDKSYIKNKNNSLNCKYNYCNNGNSCKCLLKRCENCDDEFITDKSYIIECGYC